MEGEEEASGVGEEVSEVAPALDQEEAGSQEDHPHAHLHQDHHHQVEPGAHQVILSSDLSTWLNTDS